MHVEQTKGQFGFHLDGGVGERHIAEVQIYVRSSVMSRAADLAISPPFIREDEIDQFVDEAIESLKLVRVEAKRALAAACTE